MKYVKAFLDYIKLLHIILMLGIALFVFYFVWPQYGQSTAVSLPAVRPAETVATGKTPEETMPGIMDYAIIADKNIFHPERIIPVEKKEKPPEPKPEIVLFGTILSDRGNMAHIEDKKQEYAPTPGRGKRHRTVKIGDSIQGFIVKEIKSDSIMLQRGEEKIFASLKDKHRRGGNPRHRGAGPGMASN